MALTGEPEAAGDAAGTSDPEQPTGDPESILRGLPRDAQLLLRDYIVGLEAQAGTARARADRIEKVHSTETNILLGKLKAARSERDAALNQLGKLKNLPGGPVVRRWIGR